MFHESCIECWMNISHCCPICKQDTECTKLYLDLEYNDNIELKQEIDTLKNKISEYQKLAMAQSKSIATKSYKIWESEMKIKEMKDINIKLKDTIKQLKTKNQLQSQLNINKLGALPINHTHLHSIKLCLYPVYQCTCNNSDVLSSQQPEK